MGGPSNYGRLKLRVIQKKVTVHINWQGLEADNGNMSFVSEDRQQRRRRFRNRAALTPGIWTLPPR